jgi:hypothetical protein
MRKIEEVYPGIEEGFWMVSDYDPLLESMGYEILLQIDDEDYQGDSRLLFKNGDQYGLLIFGWGSCSGCDALQACDTFKEIEELREGLNNDIKWDTREGLLKYIEEKDWELEWSWHAEETKEFVDKVIELLKGLK